MKHRIYSGKKAKMIFVISAICVSAVGALMASYLNYGFGGPASEIGLAPSIGQNTIISAPVTGIKPLSGAPVNNFNEILSSCIRSNGRWLPPYKECENVGVDWCDLVNGAYNECASACRHNPDPRIMCTMQCVPVCKISG